MVVGWAWVRVLQPRWRVRWEPFALQHLFFLFFVWLSKDGALPSIPYVVVGSFGAGRMITKGGVEGRDRLAQRLESDD